MLVLGANSDMAKTTVKVFAKHDFDFILCSRYLNNIRDFKSELENVHGSKVTLEHFDALDFTTHLQLVKKLDHCPDIVLCAFGYLGDQIKAQNDFEEAKKIIETNFTGAVSILNALVPILKENRKGTIIGISSVAGDRGRRSNYIYGSAKAAFSAYLNGLRSALHEFGIHVILIKPGYVNTKMIKGKSFPKLLIASREQVAMDIYQAYQKKRAIVYSKWQWKWIMFVIRLIPERIFKRLSM